MMGVITLFIGFFYLTHALVSQDINDLAPIDQHLEKEHQEKTKVKNIQAVEVGKFEVWSCPRLDMNI